MPDENFKTSVLEIVRIIQAALSIFGMFSLVMDDRDGLICDNTVEGMQRWADEIGVYFDLEVMPIFWGDFASSSYFSASSPWNVCWSLQRWPRCSVLL
jgi:hypothetical protein